MIFNAEIWGCGGEQALEYQKKYQKSEDIRINNARKVDKAELANNAFNREYLLADTFKNTEHR